MAAKNKIVGKNLAKTGSGPIKGAAKKTSGEFGEGNYRASQRFGEQQETFVRKNKGRIPALGKQAEAALQGPEGKELRAAEENAAKHAAGKS